MCGYPWVSVRHRQKMDQIFAKNTVNFVLLIWDGVVIVRMTELKGKFVAKNTRIKYARYAKKGLQVIFVGILIGIQFVAFLFAMNANALM